MKKAFLVTFEVTTRVVADVDKEFNPCNCNLINKKDRQAFNSLMIQARNNIIEEPQNYLYEGNTEIVEDIECPYDSNMEE